ncbi:MAG: hypothetical protein P8130_07490 [Deltaproteobacteria bacterium]
MTIWKFSVEENTVKAGSRTRKKITAMGCNEPFKGRYWCPKLQWFRPEVCPFENKNECEAFKTMCGSL